MTDWKVRYETERARTEQLLTAGHHLFTEYEKAKRKADLLDALFNAAEHAGYIRKETPCPTTSKPSSESSSNDTPQTADNPRTTITPTP